MKNRKAKETSALSSGTVSRRQFLTHSGTTLSGAVLLPTSLLQQSKTTDDTKLAYVSHIQLTVNGIRYNLEVSDYATLAEVLRDQLGFTGVKIGCNRGECGACTVILDGKAVYSCSQIAALANGSKITTIEGLAKGEELHPLQEAFIGHDALQCGFCTPGQIMAAKALLDANPSPTEDEVKRGLAGNLCRCACYNYIVGAVLAAAPKMRGKS